MDSKLQGVHEGGAIPIYGYLQRWAYDGTLDNLHYELYQKCREQAEREASPTACIIDSQSVKSAEKGGLHRSQRV